MLLTPNIVANFIQLESDCRNRIATSPKPLTTKILLTTTKLSSNRNRTLALKITDNLRNRIFWRNRYHYMLLYLRGNIPTFIHISDGKLHDVNVLDILLPEAGAFYIMDRGYVDFERLFTLHMASAFFVIRAKSNTQYQRRYSRPVDNSTSVKCDQTIVLTGVNTATDYPQPLRRIKYHDENTGKTFNFLTNNFAIPAQTVADLYRYRWQVELFFKWIKQHLRIKSFFGTSENAVKTQIWIAISVYVLVAIIKKRLNLSTDLYTILQILSLTLFEKDPLEQMLANSDYKTKECDMDNQLNFFDNLTGQ